MTLDLPTVQAIVGFALDEGAAGGHIACFIVGAPAETSGLFANAVPLSQPQATMIAAEIHSAITLDWAASGRKAPRIYQITIKDRAQNIRTERRIACAPEETRPEDALSAAVQVGIACLSAAGGAMVAPHRELKDIIELQKGLMDRDRALHDQDQAQIRSLLARNQELEKERSGAVDALMQYIRTESEGRLHSAQADAITLEAKAKAGMYDGIKTAALVNAPTVLQIGAKIAGLHLDRPPPNLARAAAGLAAAAPGLAAAMGVGSGGAASAPTTPPRVVSDLSTEAVAELRAWCAKITDTELARLVRWAYLKDSDGRTIGQALGQLDPENRTGALGLLRLLPGDWTQ